MTTVLLSGTGSDFILLAPLARAFNACSGLSCKIVYTGRYDDSYIGRPLFDEMGMGEPDFILNAQDLPCAHHLSDTMGVFENLYRRLRPALVFVAGDGDAALASALTAAKQGIRVAHTEAGMRCHDKNAPGEINRLVIDTVTDIFFVTESQAMVNLKKEGKPGGAIHFVGNVLVDSLYYRLGRLDSLPRKKFSSTRFKSKHKEYAVAAVASRSLTDDPARLSCIMDILGCIAKRIPLAVPIMPGIQKKLDAFGIRPASELFFLPGLSHMAFLDLWKDARLVITDSGRLQEETTILGIPCLTLGDLTDRSATVSKGTNELVGISPEKAMNCLDQILAGRWKQGTRPEFWDGRAAQRIVELIMIKEFHLN
ncbi:MAG: UDP-N-acetylglucosamine 2-epimerase [Desulfobacter sp.]|nr:MAG: UDP-N-acetylglucosamine 2-epimerase [Desulfobacter sp.]